MIGTMIDVPVAAPVSVSCVAPTGASAGSWTETDAVP